MQDTFHLFQFIYLFFLFHHLKIFQYVYFDYVASSLPHLLIYSLYGQTKLFLQSKKKLLILKVAEKNVKPTLNLSMIFYTLPLLKQGCYSCKNHAFLFEQFIFPDFRVMKVWSFVSIRSIIQWFLVSYDKFMKMKTLKGQTCVNSFYILMFLILSNPKSKINRRPL